LSFTAIVFTGGDPVAPTLRHRLPRPDLVIAADSGYHLAQLLGIPVDLVIGDLDSIDADVDLGHTEVLPHPADKEESDLELALAAASARGATNLVVVGGGGGRLDHLLVNAAVIAGYRGGAVQWFTGAEIVYVVSGTQVIPGSIGDLVTLLAVGGDAHGVTTRNLRYPLDRETLRFGSARGLSNVMLTTDAEVAVESGVLIAVHVPA
jgi:thiamine pyrophosphokinase